MSTATPPLKPTAAPSVEAALPTQAPKMVEPVQPTDPFAVLDTVASRTPAPSAAGESKNSNQTVPETSLARTQEEIYEMFETEVTSTTPEQFAQDEVATAFMQRSTREQRIDQYFAAHPERRTDILHQLSKKLQAIKSDQLDGLICNEAEMEASEWLNAQGIYQIGRVTADEVQAYTVSRDRTVQEADPDFTYPPDIYTSGNRRQMEEVTGSLTQFSKLSDEAKNKLLADNNLPSGSLLYLARRVTLWRQLPIEQRKKLILSDRANHLERVRAIGNALLDQNQLVSAVPILLGGNVTAEQMSRFSRIPGAQDIAADVQRLGRNGGDIYLPLITGNIKVHLDNNGLGIKTAETAVSYEDKVTPLKDLGYIGSQRRTEDYKPKEILLQMFGKSTG